MADPLLVKLAIGAGALALFSKKSKGKDVDPLQAESVITGMPEEKQAQAMDYVEVMVWYQTDNGTPHVAYGTFGANVPPGWKVFNSKDALINGLLDGYFPNTDQLWNSSLILSFDNTQRGSSKYNGLPVSSIVQDLLGHALNTSKLTRIDKYNLLNALTWPTYNAVTGTVNVPPVQTGSFPSTWAPRTKAEFGFIHLLQVLIENYRAQGGNTGYGDLGYVRFNRAFQNDGSRWYIEPPIYDPASNERIATGNYTDMQHFLNYAAGLSNRPTDWGYASLTAQDRANLIDAYFTSNEDLNNTLGPKGPHSTYISSLLSSVNISKAWTVISDVGLAVGAIAATMLTGFAALPADLLVLKKISDDFK